MRVPVSVGARLRALRVGRGLTLAEVAGSEVSVGLLSKLERDLVNPSIQTLHYLAGRLGVSTGALLADERGEQAAIRWAARGALDASRAYLLLGDPARAASTALDAAHAVDQAPELRARLLAVAADAVLAAGDAGRAVLYLRDATALVAGVGAGGTGSVRNSGGDAEVVSGAASNGGAAQTELAWVLGALERRRGALADAERTWTRCLASLEEQPVVDSSPWWPYLRANVLAELGGLAESHGDPERARNLVARASSIAAGIAQAAGPAAGLLSRWHEGDTVAGVPAATHAALALAVVAAADRLSRRLAQEAARLERTAWDPRPRAPDLAVSRGL